MFKGEINPGNVCERLGLIKMGAIHALTVISKDSPSITPARLNVISPSTNCDGLMNKVAATGSLRASSLPTSYPLTITSNLRLPAGSPAY